ncbi:MAG: site-2 protease family protein [Candidatus Woesearchaeota archaeon]
MAFIERLMGTAFYIDVALAIIFIGTIALFLLKNKKNVSFEKMAFPLLYAILYRGKFGIARMKKFVAKHREAIKVFGYSSIGFGFFGMIAAVFLIAFVIYRMIANPAQATVAPFLPFVEVPILGYISFSHWIITIFVIVIVHESAHALVAMAHGLKVKNTGFGLFAIFIPFLPAAFVEPDDEALKKADDVVKYSVFAAGPMSNFVLFVPLLLILLFVITPVEGLLTGHNGFTFDIEHNETLPANMSGISSGTVFNTVNGNLVIDAREFSDIMYRTRPNESVMLAFVNEVGETEYEYTLVTAVNPNNPEIGYIGVLNLRNNVFIKEEYSQYAGIVSWFKGLFLLMTEITFSLGLINLFPASITDGGQMFSLYLEKVSSKKKLNKILILTLALIFLAVIIFSFIRYFM